MQTPFIFILEPFKCLNFLKICLSNLYSIQSISDVNSQRSMNIEYDDFIFQLLTFIVPFKHFSYDVL